MFAGKINKVLFVFGILAAAGLMITREIRAAQLSGPSLGYLADPMSSALQVINGIPGALSLGEPVRLDLKFRSVQVSVKGDYALAVTDDNTVVVIRNLSRAISISAIAGVYTGGDALALNADGSSAVIYSLANSRLQVVGGLPSNPLVHFEVDTSSLGQVVTALAVNKFEQVLAALANGETGTLYLFNADKAPQFIGIVGNISGISFSTAGDRAVFADRAWNQVALLQDLSATPTPIFLADHVDGISDPIGIRLSDNGQTAYIANQTSGTVAIVHASGGAVRHVSCNCRPTMMQRLQRDSLFALTDGKDQPIVLFDGDSSDSQVLLVPGGRYRELTVEPLAPAGTDFHFDELRQDESFDERPEPKKVQRSDLQRFF